MIAENLRTNEVMNRMIKHSLEKIRSLNLVGWISLSLLRNCFFFLFFFLSFFLSLIRMRRSLYVIIEQGERFTKRGRVGKEGLAN